MTTAQRLDWRRDGGDTCARTVTDDRYSVRDLGPHAAPRYEATCNGRVISRHAGQAGAMDACEVHATAA